MLLLLLLIMDNCALIIYLLKQILKTVQQIEKSVGKFPIVLTLPDNDKIRKISVNSLADAWRESTASFGQDFSEIYKVIDPREFNDCVVPKRFLYPNASGDQRIENYAQLGESLIRQIDKAVGFTPFTVSVKDANPTLEGDQSVVLQIHSLADGQKQILQYLIDTEGDTDAVVNIGVRNLYESGLTHHIAASTDSKVQAILDYLNPKVKWKTDYLPMAFDPSAGRAKVKGFGQNGQVTPPNLEANTEEKIEVVLPFILKACQYPIKVVDYTDKKPLNEWLIEINKNAAMASAATAERYTPSVIQKLMESARFVNTMTRFFNREDLKQVLGIGDPSEWVPEAESGYPSTSGKFEQDPSKAYNQPIVKRPQIKRRKRRDRRQR